MILAMRTDKPEAEILLIDSGKIVESCMWNAHRELSDTLLIKIEDLLSKYGESSSDLAGVAVYSGPGSFTGLRIGVSVANTLAYSLSVPIWGLNENQWQQLPDLDLSNDTKIVVPEYGQAATVTQPRK